MRVAIVGSRVYPRPFEVWRYVFDLPDGDVVVSGGAAGVDTMAVRAAQSRGMHHVVFPADWQRFGRSAGYRRNQEIVANCDRVVAFWDGRSKGTKHTIDLAKKAGVPIVIIQPHRGGTPGGDE